MGQGYRIDVFNNTTRTLNIVAPVDQMQNISVCGISGMQLAPGEWAGTAITAEPAVLRRTQRGDKFRQARGRGGQLRQRLVHHPVRRGLAAKLSRSGVLRATGQQSPAHPVSEGSATGWIDVSLYLKSFGQWTGVLVMLMEATGASGGIQPPYQIN